MTLRRALALIASVSALVLVALVAWGYGEASRPPVLVRYAVDMANWPAGAPPLRIVQLSDIHVSWPDMPLSRVTRIVAQVNALEPDLVVLTGDYLGGKLWDPPGPSYDAVVRRLGRMQARYGVVAVRGNHDNSYWTPIVFGRSPVRLLKNKWVRVGPVIVAGVDDLTASTHPVANMRRAIAGIPAGAPVVLLAHEPDAFQWLDRRVDLLIAGHTHGGQLLLPGVASRYLGPYLMAHRRGVFAAHGQRMIVSSGIGTSLVPLRIGVPPEIVEVTLGPAYSVGRNSGTDR